MPPDCWQYRSSLCDSVKIGLPCLLEHILHCSLKELLMLLVVVWWLYSFSFLFYLWLVSKLAWQAVVNIRCKRAWRDTWFQGFHFLNRILCEWVKFTRGFVELPFRISFSLLKLIWYTPRRGTRERMIGLTNVLIFFLVQRKRSLQWAPGS